MKNNNRELLFKKLNNFISKYYKNKIIQGIMLLFSTLFLFFILFSTLEHFYRFQEEFRIILFFGYLALNLIILIYYVVIPTLHLLRVGKVLNYKESSKIIGEHFSEIEDKITNVLELNQMSEKNNDLINASIEQKINQIKPFSFSSVIKLKDNKKHLKWMVVPVLIFLFFIISGNQHVLTESSSRIINYNVFYEKPLPFDFFLETSEFSVFQGEDYVVDLVIKGKEIPSKVFIEINGNRFTMKQESINTYSYLIKNIVSDITFQFYANNIYSKRYDVKSLSKPFVQDFKINLNFPKYTGLKNNILENIGDMIIPEGTSLEWEFNVKNTDSLLFMLKNENKKLIPNNNKLYVKEQIFSNINYSISAVNNHIKSSTANYKIDVIKDEYPKINIASIIDSSNNKIISNGIISDDYSVTRLTFNYTIYKLDSTITKYCEIPVYIKNEQKFHHIINLDTLNLTPSDKIAYYFELWDNDEINGHKSIKSSEKTYQELSISDLKNKKHIENEKIKTDFKEAMNLSKEIEKDLKDLLESLINKSQLGWDEKTKAKNIINKNKQLNELISKNNKRNNKKNILEEKLNSSILNKQKKLEELMTQVLNDDQKNMMEELEKLLEEMNKEKLKDVLEKIDEKNTNTEKDLERNLELYKQLDFEQSLEELIKNIDLLKKQQELLKNQTDSEDSKSKKLEENQESLEKDLEKLKKELNALKEKNEELENKNKVPETKKNEEDASLNMKNSKESLSKKQKKKSSKEQKKVIENLEEISEKMEDLQSSCSKNQSSEDMNVLRQILENLITLSFNQEELINSISNIPAKSSSIIKYIQMQKKLEEDAKIIEDSLFALSKRVIQIEPIINQEIRSIKSNSEKAISLLESRKINLGLAKQQFVMTSTNNLALLLSETLKQMQLEMANQTPGTKQCNKPGNSSIPSLKELQKMQKNMTSQMKKGNKGEKGREQSNTKNKELMQLGIQQEKIRNNLEKLMQEINGNQNKQEINNIIQKMKENEIDIINNQITNETMMRQKEILNKLLKAEESQNEQEEDQTKESNEWIWETNEKTSYEELEEYKKNITNQEELLRKFSLELNPFYKNKVNSYFNKITQEKE